MNPALATLLDAAVRAPSGDNTQPWHFAVNEPEGRVTLLLDPARDPSPMNTGQRMARIALGAALENMVRTAHFNGWSVTDTSTTAPTLTVDVSRSAPRAGRIEPTILQRVTNRRVYDGRTLPPDLLQSLQRQTPEQDRIRCRWIVHRPDLRQWADFIARTDAILLADPAIREAFLGNVRFDASSHASVAEGLSLAALELSRLDRLALRTLRRLPQWLVLRCGVPRLFARHARRLVESASGLCLVVAPDDRQETDVRVGRAVQHVWLALTAAGLAVQPMMSPLVLDNILEHGGPEHLAFLDRGKQQSLQNELRALEPEIGSGRPAFLLRFGYALPPTGRTGRRPWQVSTDSGPRFVPGAPVAQVS